MKKKILNEFQKLSISEIVTIIDVVIWEYHQNINHSLDEKNLCQKMNKIRRIIEHES